MTLVEDLRQAWRVAQDDLAIEVVVPYVFESEMARFECIALVPQFGAAGGMLVVTRDAVDFDVVRAAADDGGYGFSFLGKPYALYNRSKFIDLLEDWGWGTRQGPVPDWYHGETPEDAVPSVLRHELVIGSDHVRLIIGDLSSGPGGYDPWATFTATLQAPGLEASARVDTYGWEPVGLDDFLQGLAERWRGWDGEIGWQAAEGGLSCVAVREASRNLLRISIASGTPRVWSATSTISIEPGEEMSTVARDLRALLDAARRR